MSRWIVCLFIGLYSLTQGFSAEASPSAVDVFRKSRLRAEDIWKKENVFVVLRRGTGNNYGGIIKITLVRQGGAEMAKEEKRYGKDIQETRIWNSGQTWVTGKKATVLEVYPQGEMVISRPDTRELFPIPLFPESANGKIKTGYWRGRPAFMIDEDVQKSADHGALHRRHVIDAKEYTLLSIQDFSEKKDLVTFTNIEQVKFGIELEGSEFDVGNGVLESNNYRNTMHIINGIDN